MKEMKTLTIGNTTYEVVDETAREEASKSKSWNNLTDKPFGEKEGEIEEEFLTSAEGTFINGLGTLSFDALISGDTYLVIFDDTEYACKAIAGQIDGFDAVMAGNISAAIEMGFVCDSTELPQNNEPFIIGTVWVEGVLRPSITCLDDMDVASSTHTVGIKHLTVGTIVETLDEKYLPKDAIVSWIDEYMEEALGGEF